MHNNIANIQQYIVSYCQNSKPNHSFHFLEIEFVMINKIEKLVSIGKYRDYQAAGQVNFKKLTLIYGDNGGGKTTLTSIFRSLSANDPSIIQNRISTNHTAPQAVQISQVGTPNVFYTFGARGWSNQFPDIEIFDIHFVNENVYSGFDFSEDHKKQLHQFVVGAQGVSIQNQIEQNKSDKASTRQLISEIENQLTQLVANNLTSNLIGAFISMPQAEANNIDQRIANAEAELRSANANTTIQTLQNLSQIQLISTGIDFQTLIVDLQTSSTTIQDRALEALFSDHCQELETNGIHGAETWLQTGFKFVENKRHADVSNISCPFCKQELLPSIEIINAYTTKFDEEFRALASRLQSHYATLRSLNLDAIILAINTTMQSNNQLASSWGVHLPNGVSLPQINVVPDEEVLKSEFENILTTVQQKLQNPTVVLPITSVTTFQLTGQAINANIRTYNQNIQTYNSAIIAFRAGIQTVSVAQEKLDALYRIKKRFDPTIASLCNRYTSERQKLRALENTYTQLSQQQQATATAFFCQYQDRINHYLKDVFKTPFQIENVLHVAPQGRSQQSKVSYKLTIDGNDISFAHNQPFSAKTCLSEGDKSTIALAFFLSKLDIDPNIENKILIFDDPLSSLDTNRRSYTISIIRTLLEKLKQVVVLSHSEHFLHEVGKDIGIANKCTLRITEDFVAKASKIEVCNLDELVKIDYFKHIEALESFRSNPNHLIKDSVLGWLRNVLEAHLRFKFYKEIRSMTRPQTFGNLIDHLKNYPVVFRDNTNRAGIISKLHLINSVSWKPHHGDPSPDYSALGMNPNSITASELDGLIQDTLLLIDQQL